MAAKRTKKPTAAPTLSPDFHRHLVLACRKTQPYGKALVKALKALDLDEAAIVDEAAAALLDAVELTPAMLASVTRLSTLDLDGIHLVTAQFDGEEDLFKPASLDELLLLPNLEQLCWPTGMPPPPIDPTPLLRLEKLQRVELAEFDFTIHNSRYGRYENTKAIDALEAARFERVPGNEGLAIMARR